MLSLVCRKSIEEDEATTKELNRGGKVGVMRHESRAQSVSSCQYNIVDLTKIVTEELPVKRNEDLFPCDRLTGNIRVMPESNDTDDAMDNGEAGDNATAKAAADAKTKATADAKAKAAVEARDKTAADVRANANARAKGASTRDPRRARDVNKK